MNFLNFIDPYKQKIIFKGFNGVQL
jgi:hypothetical protein